MGVDHLRPTSRWREPGTKRRRTSVRPKQGHGLRVWRATVKARVAQGRLLESAALTGTPTAQSFLDHKQGLYHRTRERLRQKLGDKIIMAQGSCGTEARSLWK